MGNRTCICVCTNVNDAEQKQEILRSAGISSDLCFGTPYTPYLQLSTLACSRIIVELRDAQKAKELLVKELSA